MMKYFAESVCTMGIQMSSTGFSMLLEVALVKHHALLILVKIFMQVSLNNFMTYSYKVVEYISSLHANLKFFYSSQWTLHHEELSNFLLSKCCHHLMPGRIGLLHLSIILASFGYTSGTCFPVKSSV